MLNGFAKNLKKSIRTTIKMDAAKYINIDGVIERSTLSRSVIYRLMQSGFPLPYSIKGVDKRKVWAVAEVDKWLSENVLKIN